MLKKRGFTLIELISTLVVISVLAMIAIPVVMNLIEKSKIAVSEQSATSYVKAVENAIMKKILNGENVEDGEYEYNSIPVDIKGTRPIGGIYKIENGSISVSTLCINGYKIEYKQGKSTMIADDCDDMSIIDPPEEDNDNLSIGLMGKYNYENAEQNTLIDLSGNGRNAIMNGVKVTDNGLLFDGELANDYISLYEFTPSKFSYTVAFMPVELNSLSQVVIGNIEAGGCGITVNKNNKLQGTCYINGAYRPIVTDYVLEEGTLYVATLSFDGKKLSFYVNGELIGTYESEYGITYPSNSTILMLGQNPSGLIAKGDFFFGSIYYFDIYERDLSLEEIDFIHQNLLVDYAVKKGDDYEIGIFADYNYQSVNSSDFLDLSGNGNNGTINNISIYENTIIFDGNYADDYISLYEFTPSKFSYTVTFTPVELNNLSQIIIGNIEAGGCGITVNKNNKLQGMCYINGAYRPIVTDYVLEEGTLYVATLSFDGKKLSFYVNGELIGTYESEYGITYPSNSTILMLGQNPSGLIAKGDAYEGIIYDLKIHSRALKQNEVSELHDTLLNNYSFNLSSKIMTGLLADFKSSYVNNTGSNLVDLSGNGNNGEINGATFNDGKLYFDGKNDYVKLKAYDMEKISLVVSFEQSSLLNKAQTIIGNLESGGCAIVIGASNILRGQCYIDGAYRVINHDVIVPNTKYNAVLTYDGNDFKFYVNDTLVGSYSNNAGITAPNLSTIYMLGTNPKASNPIDQYFGGNIYSVKIYNRALKLDEIVGLDL